MKNHADALIVSQTNVFVSLFVSERKQIALTADEKLHTQLSHRLLATNRSEMRNKMDIKSPEQRSRNMVAIHSRNTKPEMYFRRLLFTQGYRYSLNSGKIPGHPDIYLRKYNAAIFIHGCFWHRHLGCRYAYLSKSRIEFWQKKFDANISRYYVVRKEHRGMGLNV